ncbi:hypothetical protein C0Q70_02855 [Pomacea canaliculata]|uniref:Uncharacterized protein n=1 Tax=Pomacea canaliculata TaxID=400727 RepID=A0A2T7PR29_POMCA|nr:hypothetical protein C0Q70_02855 [Pomacea canaliculata]
MSDNNEAIDEADATLNSPNNDTNIVALANMAVMQWKMGDREEAERLVNNLEELRGKADFSDKVLDAKAEMAYFYSRIGMKSSSLAVELFEEVVQERPREYSWKYSLALVLRRFTHINFRMYYQLSSEITSQMALRAFDLLVEIRNSDAPKIMKGRALTELGMLLEQAAFLPELKNATKGSKNRPTQAKLCFKKAVELAPRDVHVLTYSGKYFMKNDLEKSLELLERAIDIRPTTTAHHYLGNTYVKMAKVHQKRKSRQHFRGGSSMGRGQRKGKIKREIKRDTDFCFDRREICCQNVLFIGFKKLSSMNVNQACKLLGDDQYFRADDEHINASIRQRQSGGRKSASAVISRHHNHPDFQSWDYKMMIKSSIKPASIQLPDKRASFAQENYQHSITLSREDNPPAIYDLGVFYVLVGDDDEALNQFTILINQTEFLRNSLQIINAYEQSGLIYRRKKHRAKVKKAEEKHAAESRKMFQAALQMQCQFVSSIHTCVPDFKATRPSFFELCSAGKSKNSQEIQFEVARLFDMIKVYVDYLSVLKEMRGFRPRTPLTPSFWRQH